jgi:hypothetical protein
MGLVQRKTFRATESNWLKSLNEEKDKKESYIQQLPFELIMIIATYCASEESYCMISLNKEIRSYFLAAKTIIYRQMFCKKASSVPDER